MSTSPDPDAEAELPSVPSRSVGALRVIARAVVSVPRWILLGLLFGWRAVVSPLYGPVCRFYPSCSAYAVEAVTVHGAVRGSWLTVRRLVRCNPFHTGGVDHVPHGDQVWPEGRVPRIVRLNHPPIPADAPEQGGSEGMTPIEHRHRAA